MAMAARGELLRGGSVLRWWEEAGGGFGGAGEEEDDGLLCVCVCVSHGFEVLGV